MLDLDNTLGDRDAAVRKWIAEFCDCHALTAADAEWIHQLDEDGYRPRVDAFAQIRARFRLEASVDDLLGSYRQRVVELTTPTAGARDCLRSLRDEACRIAIVTNGTSSQQHAKVDLLGFRVLVDAVVVSGDLHIKKPDRRIFDQAAAAAGSTLSGAWMVGDSASHDVAGAAALGVRTVWIRRGRSWPLDAVHPTAIIDSLNQLMPILSGEH